jgi:acyl transferase domain-containing protein
MVIKPLDAALIEHDQIYAVVWGSSSIILALH